MNATHVFDNYEFKMLQEKTKEIGMFDFSFNIAVLQAMLYLVYKPSLSFIYKSKAIFNIIAIIYNNQQKQQ